MNKFFVLALCAVLVAGVPLPDDEDESPCSKEPSCPLGPTECPAHYINAELGIVVLTDPYDRESADFDLHWWRQREFARKVGEAFFGNETNDRCMALFTHGCGNTYHIGQFCSLNSWQDALRYSVSPVYPWGNCATDWTDIVSTVFDYYGYLSKRDLTFNDQEWVWMWTVSDSMAQYSYSEVGWFLENIVGWRSYIVQVGDLYVDWVDWGLDTFATSPISETYIQVSNYTDLSSSVLPRLIRDMWGVEGQQCDIFQGAHISTFDGANYDIQEYGVHVLAKSADDVFRVIQKRYPTGEVDYLIIDGQFRIEAYYVNGLEPQFYDTYGHIYREPYPYESDDYSSGDYGYLQYFYFDSFYNMTGAFIQTPSGHEIFILNSPQWQQVRIVPAPFMLQNMAGLCGDWNGCPLNEFTLRNGETLLSNISFEEQKAMSTSWRATKHEDDLTFMNKGDFTPYAYPAFNAASDAAVAACQGVSSAWLRQNCEADITNFGRDPLVARGYQTVAKDACDSVATLGVFASHIVKAGECNMGCFVDRPFIDLHQNYSIDNVPFEIYDDSFDHAAFRAPLGGSYIVTANVNLCQGYTKNLTINLRCDGQLLVNAGADRWVSKGPYGYPMVQLLGSVSSSSASTQVSWRLMEYPENFLDYGGYFEGSDTGCSVLEPMFHPVIAGVYIFELAAYDGCQLFKDNVTVNVICGHCPTDVEVFGTQKIEWQGWDSDGFPSDWNYLWASFPESEIFPDDDETYDWQWDFVLDWANETDGTYYTFDVEDYGWEMWYYIYRETPEVPINSTSELYFDYETDGNGDTETPVKRDMGYRYSSIGTNHWMQNVAVNFTYNYTLSLVKQSTSEYICAIGIEWSWSSEIGYIVYDDDWEGNCARLFKLRVNVSNECTTVSKLVPIDAHCTKPVAIFNRIPPQKHIPGGSYNGYNSIYLRDFSYESYDLIAQNNYLGYDYRVVSRPAGSNKDNNPSGSYFRPDAPGLYTMELIVDSGCATDTDTVTFRVDCGPVPTKAVVVVDSVVPGVSFLNKTWDGSNNFFDLSATSSNGSLSYWQLSYQWSVSLNGVVQENPSDWFDSPNYYNTRFYPRESGAYRVSVTVSDYCSSDTASVTLVFTCGAALSPVTLPTTSVSTWDPVGQNFPALTFNLTGTYLTPSIGGIYYSWKVNGSAGPSGSSALTYVLAPNQVGRTTIEASTFSQCGQNVQTITADAVCGQTVTAVLVSDQANNRYQVEESGSYPIMLNASFSVNAKFYRFWLYNMQGGLLAGTGFSSTPTYQFNANKGESYKVRVEASDGCARGSTTITISPVCTHTISLTPSATTVSSQFNDGKFAKVNVDVATAISGGKAWDNSIIESWEYVVVSAPAESMFWPYQKTSNVTTWDEEEQEDGYDNLPGGLRMYYNYVPTLSLYSEWTRWATLMVNNAFDDLTLGWAPDVAGTFVIRLDVTNWCGTKTSVSITVNAACNAAPSVNILGGVNQTVYFNGTQTDPIIVDARNTTDADGDFVTFSWGIVGSPFAMPPRDDNLTYVLPEIEEYYGWMFVLRNANSSAVQFLPTRAGVYTLLLNVTDGCSFVQQLITITVACNNVNPNWLIAGNRESSPHVALPLAALPCGNYYWEVVEYTPILPPPPVLPDNQQENEQQSGSGNNLTTADVVGLAVGIPLGILLLVAIIVIIVGVIIFMKRKKSAANLPEVQPS